MLDRLGDDNHASGSNGRNLSIDLGCGKSWPQIIDSASIPSQGRVRVNHLVRNGHSVLT